MKKILVIQKKMMGDVLASSIVFELLRKKYPSAELHYLIDKKYEQIIQHHQMIDKVLFLDGFFSTAKMIRAENYDVVVDIYAKIGTAALSFISGIKKRISFHKKYTALAYTDTIGRNSSVHFPRLGKALEHRLLLLKPLGIEVEEVFPKIFISEKEEKEAELLLEHFGVKNEKLLMISTFGSCSEKTYPIPYMAEILEKISEKSEAKILCNYLPSQKAQFEDLYSLLSEKAKQRVVKDFDTKNLRQYIAVLSKCKALIGNEGGSTNISKALEIPTFSIYAPFVSGWDWGRDEQKNIFIHSSKYGVEQYSDFKPHLFEKELMEFLKINCENN